MAGGDKKIRFDRPIYVITEGSTDEKVISNIVGVEMISKYRVFSKGGKPGLKDALDLLYTELPAGFNNTILEKICIIVDADESAKSTFQFVKGLIESKNQEYPDNMLSIPDVPNQFITQNGKFRVGIFILPDNESSGCMETLMIGAVKHVQLQADTKVYSDRVVKYYNNVEKPVQLNSAQVSKLHYRLHCQSMSVEHKFDMNDTYKYSIDYNNEVLASLKNFLLL